MFLQTVIRALEKHSIKYALVGGYAVALHGAVRGTVDIDIVIALTRTSLEGTESALGEIGMKIRVAAIPDLFTLKKKSGHPQDIEDIRVLEKLL